MKVLLRTLDGEQESKHEIPPSEIEAFITLCRKHPIYDGIHDPGIMDVTTQMCLYTSAFEIIVDPADG